MPDMPGSSSDIVRMMIQAVDRSTGPPTGPHPPLVLPDLVCADSFLLLHAKVAAVAGLRQILLLRPGPSGVVLANGLVRPFPMVQRRLGIHGDVKAANAHRPIARSRPRRHMIKGDLGEKTNRR